MESGCCMHVSNYLEREGYIVAGLIYFSFLTYLAHENYGFPLQVFEVLIAMSDSDFVELRRSAPKVLGKKGL